MTIWDEENKKDREDSDELMILGLAAIYDIIRKEAKAIAARWREASPDDKGLRWLQFNRRNERLIKDVKKMSPQYLKADNFIKARFETDYNTEYYRQAYSTVQQFRSQSYNVKINKYLGSQFKEAITNPLSKYMDPSLLAADRAKSMDRLYHIMRSGIIDGDSLQNINKGIDTELGYRDSKTGKLIKKPANYKGDFSKRMTVLRTELSRVRSSAETDEYKKEQEQGIESDLVLVEVLDNKTRPQSAQMDGQKADENGEFLFPDGTRAPRGRSGKAKWDINDRSTTITVLKDDAIENYTRSRKIGKKVEIVPYQTYYDYAKETGMVKNKYGQVLFPES